MRPKLAEITVFTSPYCVDFHFVGGRYIGSDGVTHFVFGKGRTKVAAQVRLYGEAAERASVLPSTHNDVWLAEDPLTRRLHRIKPRVVFGAAWQPNSHGCAAHSQFETAQMSAAFELFERQVVAEWWSGARTARRVLLRGTHAAGLLAEIRALRIGAPAPRETAFYALGHVAGIFVIAAVSSDPGGGRIAVAFAAHFDWTTAVQRAFYEVLTVELETADLVHADLNGHTIAANTNRAVVRDRQQAMHDRLRTEFDCAATVDLSTVTTAWPDRLATLAQTARDDGMPLLFVNMTSDAIGVPVCRAIFKLPPHLPFQVKGPDIMPL